MWVGGWRLCWCGGCGHTSLCACVLSLLWAYLSLCACVCVESAVGMQLCAAAAADMMFLHVSPPFVFCLSSDVQP